MWGRYVWGRLRHSILPIAVPCRFLKVHRSLRPLAAMEKKPDSYRLAGRVKDAEIRLASPFSR